MYDFFPSVPLCTCKPSLFPTNEPNQNLAVSASHLLGHTGGVEKESKGCPERLTQPFPPPFNVT